MYHYHVKEILFELVRRTLPFALLLYGVNLFAKAPPGVNPQSVQSFMAAASGLVVFLFWGRREGAAARVPGLLAGAFVFILGLFSLFGVIFAFLDAEYRGFLLPCLVTGCAALYGLGAVLRANRPKADPGLGAALGFQPVAGDSDYDFEGLFGGRAAAFAASEMETRHGEPCCSVSVACETANSAGLRLLAIRTVLARPVESLPERLAFPPARWEDFIFYCAPAGADLAKVTALRGVKGVFSDESGLDRLEVDGRLLKADFSHRRPLSKELVLAALAAVTSAASSFD